MSEASGTQPALDNLDVRSQELANELRSGFETLFDLLHWTRRFTTLSLGTVPDEILTGMESDPVLQKAMLNRLGEGESEYTRHLYEQFIFTPYFQKGYKLLKTSANQYAEPEKIGAQSSSSPIGLRPALAELKTRQKKSLDSLTAGFDSQQSFNDWRHQLVSATYGTVDEKILESLSKERTLRRAMLQPALEDSDNRVQAKATRLRFGFIILMPEFAKGIREMAGTSVEAPPKEVSSDFSEGLDV